MQMLSIVLIIQLCLSARHLAPHNVVNESSLSLAFGSCYGMRMFSNHIFSSINALDPYAFIWIGDFAYLDQCNATNCSIEFAHKMYNHTISDPYYMKTKRIGGVWDDHDYGINNGGTTWKYKDQYRELFLKYIEEPETSERSLRKNDGIYTDYQFTLPNNFSVRMILLDNRYSNNNVNDTLGSIQWNWLEDKLKNTNDNVYLISSGIQIMHSVFSALESFDIPSRHRLFSLIKKYRKSGVVLISGDVHYCQIYKMKCDAFELGYDIYEITSSGMTHTLYDHEVLPSFLLKFLVSDYFDYTPFHIKYNFGVVNVTTGENPTIDLSLRGLNGEILELVSLKLSDLQYKDVRNPSYEKCQKLFNMSKRDRTFNQIIDNFFHFKSSTCYLSWGILVLVLNIIGRIWFCIKSIYYRYKYKEE